MRFSTIRHWFADRDEKKRRNREAELLRNSKFEIGERIYVPEKETNALIVDMVWHYKENQPMYFLSFSGKQSSRRFWANDIRKITD